MGAKNKISGVICEFNPLHNGHEALLRRIRQENNGPIVCVMSGNFVQRGEPAALDKWSRAKLALLCGADLVIELPLPWAMSGAEHFALGGVALLNALGCVDELWFGSESGDADVLRQIASYLMCEQFSRDVAPYLSEGISFAAARGKAVGGALGEKAAECITQPNNILGIEYCKALLCLGSSIHPQTMRRIQVEHDSASANGSFASASLLRAMSAEGKDISPFVPNAVSERISELQYIKKYPARITYLERSILGYLSVTPAEMLCHTPDVSEGIENRIISAAGTASTLQELYDSVKSKRYSHARIRRIALAAYLGLTNDLPETPPYIRVLGMNEAGLSVIRSASPTLPYVMRPADIKNCSADAQRIWALEARADDLYSLCTESRRPAKLDYTEKLIRI